MVCAREPERGAGQEACESWVGTVVSGAGGEGQDAGPAGREQVLQAATRLAETGSVCDLSAGVAVGTSGPTESHQGQDWRRASAVTSASSRTSADLRCPLRVGTSRPRAWRAPDPWGLLPPPRQDPRVGPLAPQWAVGALPTPSSAVTGLHPEVFSFTW